MVTWGFPMTWDPWDPKIRQVTKASTVLSRQVQRPVLSPPDQILEQMQRTADGDKQNQLPNEIQIHCAHHSWWNPPFGFCHHDWLQMLLYSYTHTTASLVDIFFFFLSSCLYLDFCSMIFNLISSRSRYINIWSHVSSRPHGGPDDGVDFSIGIDQKPSVFLCYIMSWNMFMTLKFHHIDRINY